MEYKREQIAGPVKVLIDVPKGKKARRGGVPDKPEISYLQFAHFCKGKAVNFFLHEKEDVRGHKVLCDAYVMRRIDTQGRWLVYVDLRPTTGESTHFLRLEALESVERWEGAEDFSVFSLEQPVRLLVIPIRNATPPIAGAR